ncbi:MFS transporter [Pseudomonas umsongensis]|uniref:MFS transporter n=3 Tax=Pseudomonas TaxID=286 RepID=A0ABX4DZZ0_9PSED|nr:hypothetical protein PG5_61480 [Pseudomonas sp. G5(2012)]OXR34967.1 MFS transporter [Pseudomonas umsongensis]SDT16809.1 Predicted arabinose efflux permease, MFS family [Pseudomonas umsongensis]
MKSLLETINEFPLSVKILLTLSLARSVSFFALLPFLPIYLHEVLGFDIEQIGYLLGLCLLVGTISSVYGGYLADKINKVKLLIALDLGLLLLYLVLPPTQNTIVFLVLLVLLNTASATITVVGNALLSEQLPQEIRAKAYSLRYALQNIGAAIGPFLGAWAVRYVFNAPFWIAAAFTLLILLLLLFFRNVFTPVTPAAPADAERMKFAGTLAVLRGDQRLLLFTLGGIFSMAVYGPLLTYLSQYLIVVVTASVAYETVAYLSAANAVVVISLQYLFGSWIKEEKLLAWVSLGSAAFVVGLIGLSLSQELWIWVIAIIIFTIGEIIIVPAEYMFIDKIAPNHLRGIYFGMQNLVYMGVAIGPIVCGIALKHAMPGAMFYALISMTLVGLLFYYIGCRRTESGGINSVRVG